MSLSPDGRRTETVGWSDREGGRERKPEAGPWGGLECWQQLARQQIAGIITHTFTDWFVQDGKDTKNHEKKSKNRTEMFIKKRYTKMDWQSAEWEIWDVDVADVADVAVATTIAVAAIHWWTWDVKQIDCQDLTLKTEAGFWGEIFI